MKATITKNVNENGKWADKKEQIAAMTVCAILNGELYQPVTARFWMSRHADGAGPVYCTVWASRHGISVSGSARVTGYGYHKKSAALEAALDAAGVKLSDAIGGHGDGAMRDALTALAVALGYHKTHIVEL